MAALLSWVCGSLNHKRSMFVSSPEFHRLHQSDDKITAEADGGELINDRPSVYLHLEQGLVKSWNKPAIISPHQHASRYSALLDQYAVIDQRTHEVTSYGTKDADDLHKRGPLTMSFSQLHAISLDLATGLLLHGVQRRGRILILVPNGVEYGMLLWTSALLQLAVICIETDSLAGPDMQVKKFRDLISSLKPSLVVATSLAHTQAIDSAVDVSKGLPLLRVYCETHIDRTHIDTDNWTSLVDVIAHGRQSDQDKDEILAYARRGDPKHLHAIQFTSGTSGEPKGCPLRVGGMTHVLESQAWLLDGPAAKFALQQAHPARGIASYQSLQTWRAGGAVVMTGHGFSPKDVIEAIREHDISFLVMTPPMVFDIAELLSKEPIDVTSVRVVQIGGDSVTRSTMLKASASFPQAKIAVNVGMTEGGGCFKWPFFEQKINDIPFVDGVCPAGIVAPGARVRIWNDVASRIAWRGEVGQLHIQCESTIGHYLHGRSESSFYEDNQGRWLKTGDVAKMDVSGHVTILGREKDIIIRGGSIILPTAVESCIQEYTQTTAAVVCTPHPILGQEIWAIVDDSIGSHVASVHCAVEKSLGSVSAPGGIFTVSQLGLDAFPVSGTHKMKKEDIRDAVLKYLNL